MGQILDVEPVGCKSIQKGANNLGGFYPAYVSGSGNYTSFFVACDYDPSISSASISNYTAGDITCYKSNGAVVGFDSSYCSVTKAENGLKIELKFSSTQSPVSSVATVGISDTVTFTFS